MVSSNIGSTARDGGVSKVNGTSGRKIIQVGEKIKQ